MSEHYYTKHVTSQSKPREIEVNFMDEVYTFQTDEGVFSKSRMDYGSKVLTQAFIENTSLKGKKANLLELGSGYGPIAVLLSHREPSWKVTGVELNERAYELSLANRDSYQLDNLTFVNSDVLDFDPDGKYHAVITNPPFRAGKKIVHQFVDLAYDWLEPNGELYLVVQKKQGAPTLKKHMEEVFLNVERVALDKGYWVLVSRKEG